jgi:hypothetical protein
MDIEIPISDYVTYYVYKGDDAHILVREVKDGIFKVVIREYYGDDDEFNEDVHFIRKNTLDGLFEEYGILKKPSGTERMLEETGEFIR